MGYFEMTMTVPWLSLMIGLPILGAMMILCIRGLNADRLARTIALMVSVITLGLCIPLYCGFDPSQTSMQFQETHSWIAAYHIQYALGVDGLSLVLILLTQFIGFIVILAGCQAMTDRVPQYMAVFLLLQSTIVGVFAARDAFLFYLFWESMLIPMFLIIGMWGSHQRIYAAIKFFLFTFFGSIFMLIALLYLYHQTGSFMIEDFYKLPLALSTQRWIFVALLLGFAVKIPMWPIHTWLPDAHTEAPAGGSVILAALLLKLGVYGFLRFNMPITPLASAYFAPLMIALSLIAVIYIGLVAIIQTDMKKLIAYSSIAHMGFATLGCFLIYDLMATHHALAEASMSVEGAVVQMVAHAFSSGALFLGVGLLSARLANHSRLIKDYGGIAKVMPVFAAFFVLFAMSNVGLPGTAGFVGEFMVIMSAFQTHAWIGMCAAFTVILSASYTLWMVKRVFFGPIQPAATQFLEIHWVDKLNFSLLSAAVLFFGIYPAAITHLVHDTLGHLLLQTIPS